MPIYQLLPDAEILLGLPPEELGWYLLQVARTERAQGVGHFHPGNSLLALPNWPYPQHLHQQIELALNEGWNWLQRTGLLVPQPGPNGVNGFVLLSRRSAEIGDETGFRAFRSAAEFPKSLLHPSIADPVWLSLMRRDYGVATFHALRAVEIAVREAAGYTANEYGVVMMRSAFNPNNGPLTDMTLHMQEREGMAALFAGCFGAYKNSQSHRDVEITDPGPAQEIAMLASHLVRIVDAARARAAAAP